VDGELLAGTGQVRLDGGQADEERLRDLAVVRPTAAMCAVKELARRQPVAAAERVARRPGGGHELFTGSRGDCACAALTFRGGAEIVGQERPPRTLGLDLQHRRRP
jgi:hypothetical protein